VTSGWPPWGLPGRRGRQSRVPRTEPRQGRPPGSVSSHQPRALPQGHTLAAASPGAPLYHAMGAEIGASSSRVPETLGCSLGVPALVQGPELGKKGSWDVWLLLELGNDQDILEEEEVPPACLVALGHQHIPTEHRLG